MKTRKSLLMLVLLTTMFVTPALNSSFTIPKDTVVLQLSQDNAVTIATNTFLEDNPGAEVIQFGTLQSLLALNSPITNLVIIGHGFEDGVLTSDGLLSWQTYASKIDNINTDNAYLLNCQSNNADQYLDDTDLNIYSFAGEIDARLGAIFASAVINSADRVFFKSSLSKLFDLANKIEQNVIESITLGFEGFEPAYYIVAVIVMALAALVEAAATSPAAKTGAQAWAKIYATHHITVITALVLWWQGALDTVGFATEVLGFMDKAAIAGSLLDYIISELSYWDYLAWGVTLAATISAAIISGGASFALKIGVVTYLIADFAVSAIEDGQDCDGIIGQDPDVSCSTSDSSDDDSSSGGGGGGGTYLLTSTTSGIY